MHGSLRLPRFSSSIHRPGGSCSIAHVATLWGMAPAAIPTLPRAFEIRELRQCSVRTRQRFIAGFRMHFLIFGVGLYFLPAIIAALRHTHNATGIVLLNLFLGWTVIGWVAALLMAICSAPYCACYYHRGW